MIAIHGEVENPEVPEWISKQKRQLAEHHKKTGNPLSHPTYYGGGGKPLVLTAKAFDAMFAGKTPQAKPMTANPGRTSRKTVDVGLKPRRRL